MHRFTACPIFSQHTTGDKHKVFAMDTTLFDDCPSVDTHNTHQYERFLRDDEICVASMYAPILYPPCPILVFKAIEG